MKVRMILERETKGAVRYQEVDGAGQPITQSDPGCVIGTLYIRKSALAGKPAPDRIYISIAGDGLNA